MTSDEEKAYEDALDGSDWQVPPVDPLLSRAERAEAERDAARAEVARLRGWLAKSAEMHRAAGCELEARIIEECTAAPCAPCPTSVRNTAHLADEALEKRLREGLDVGDGLELVSTSASPREKP